MEFMFHRLLTIIKLKSVVNMLFYLLSHATTFTFSLTHTYKDGIRYVNYFNITPLFIHLTSLQINLK